MDEQRYRDDFSAVRYQSIIRLPNATSKTSYMDTFEIHTAKRSAGHDERSFSKRQSDSKNSVGLPHVLDMSKLPLGISPEDAISRGRIPHNKRRMGFFKFKRPISSLDRFLDRH